MKKYRFLILLPFVFLVAGCSLVKNDSEATMEKPVIQNSVCEIPDSTVGLETNSKNGLPPVSQEEKNKTFTYEDSELGVKMKYPGSCYFNKGIFQCSSFTMSIWPAEKPLKNITNPEITFKDGETQIVYSFNKNNKTYQLLAWYDGQNKIEIDAAVDKIAKTFTFTR